MILLIDNYDSFTYNLYQVMAQYDNAIHVVRNDKITIEMISELSPKGIVLSPGPGRPEAAGICIDIVNKFSGEIPILGVCLGHQAIAVAFGGSVVHANQIVHGKTSTIFHRRGMLYKSIPLPFQAGRYHSLVVEKRTLPSVLIIESETEDEVIMGIRHIKHLTFGVQFHPESILSEFGASILQNFVSQCNLEEKLC